MPIYSKKDSHCLFIHIPKTGGKSLAHAVWMLGWSASLIEYVRVKDMRHLKVTPQHYHGSLLEQIVRREELALVLSVCRHPFHRVKSEFYWQQRQGTAPESSPEKWLPAVLQRCSRDPWAFDNHLRPQIDFIPSGWNCTIFKLEDQGVQRAIERIDAVSPAGSVRRVVANAVRIRRHKSHTVGKVEAAFADLRQQIEDVYADDMAFFGY